MLWFRGEAFATTTTVSLILAGNGFRGGAVAIGRIVDASRRSAGVICSVFYCLVMREGMCKVCEEMQLDVTASMPHT